MEVHQKEVPLQSVSRDVLPFQGGHRRVPWKSEIYLQRTSKIAFEPKIPTIWKSAGV